MNLTLGSLFDGIGAFPRTARKHGIVTKWASEIEPFPFKVTTKHFPEMKHLGDITKINGAEIEPVDVVAFGSPCTNLSVAGKRAGLAGEQSGLFFEAVRIIREMLDVTDGQYPKFCLWENVPGAFSSNKGEDIKVVLDTMEELGFLVDMNVLNAMNMGVPQRRRRIFALWMNVDYILQSKTITSANIIIQLLTESLQIILIELLKVLGIAPKNLDLSQKSLSVDGLRRKMKLFSLHTEEKSRILLENLEEISGKLLKDQENSASYRGPEKMDRSYTEDMKSPTAREMQVESQREKCYTLPSWRNILGEILKGEKSFTTSTELNETTESRIYTCAEMLLNIACFTLRLNDYYKNMIDMTSYLVGIKECMNYARQASQEMFTELEWIQRWDDYLGRASDYTEQLERYSSRECSREVFPEQESMPRNTQESREAWEEVAACAGDCIDATGEDGCLTPWDAQGNRVVGVGGISPTLRGGGGQGYPLFRVLAPESSRINCEPGGISGTVSSKWAKGTGGPSGDEHYNLVCQPISLFDIGDRRKVADESVNVSPTLLSKMGTGGNNVPVLMRQIAFGPGESNDISHAIRAQASKADKPDSTTYIVEPIVFNGRQEPISGLVAGALDTCQPQAQCVAIQHSIIGRKDEVGAQGPGFRDDGKMFTLDSRGSAHAIAYPDPANTLLAKGNLSYRGDVDTVVAVDVRNLNETEELSRTLQVNHSLNYINPIRVPIRSGDNNADADERNSREILFKLRQEIGAEAFKEWGAGVIASLQQKTILRQGMHEGGIQEEAKNRDTELEVESHKVAEFDSPRDMSGVRKETGDGCSPQRWQLPEQRSDEPDSALQELSQLEAQAREILQNMWSKGKGEGILREALAEIQKIWKPIDDKSPRVAYQVRRLTPTETLRLQGFPDDWLDIEGASDSAKYKATGNSIANPCLDFIFGKLVEVLSKERSNPLG